MTGKRMEFKYTQGPDLFMMSLKKNNEIEEGKR